MRSIEVNGQVYSVPEENDSSEAVVTINGNEIQLNSFEGVTVVNVVIEGDVESVETSYGNVVIENNVTGSVESVTGDITVQGHLLGSVASISGNITLEKGMQGEATTVSGDIIYSPDDNVELSTNEQEK